MNPVEDKGTKKLLSQSRRDKNKTINSSLAFSAPWREKKNGRGLLSQSRKERRGEEQNN